MRIFPILIALCIASGGVAAACPPQGMARAQLTELKAAKWEVADDAQRAALATAMLDCLADPDPALRDGIGYEALQSWMRSEKLGVATMQAIRATLLTRLKTPDAGGFAQPFAALVLAEVARADRRKPFLSVEERTAFVRELAHYLAHVRDYRGYDEKEGWRHGVAHAADALLQLSLNPALGRPEHDIMLDAIASQVAPAEAHFYHYGEGERLMAPVFYLARRDTLSAADWEAWFARLGGPQGHATQAHMARIHNLKAFLLPLYAALAESQDAAQRARLLPIVTKALRALN